MGGAIARSLASSEIITENNLCVADPTQASLDALKQDFPEICTTNDNGEAVSDADIVILAVKPWLVETVINGLPLSSNQILISIAAGVKFSQLIKYVNNSAASAGKSLGEEMSMFRIIPNTAIQYGESMTFVAHHNAALEEAELVTSLFAESGMVMMIPEEKMDAATAVASCGIAFAMKYVQAAMQAAIELGFRPAEAQAMAAQSAKGAAELLLEGGSHPATEIDKVCTPGGMTIRGINELEHAGFTSAVIRAIKATMSN